jgi:site-specific recombinase XerD
MKNLATLPFIAFTKIKEHAHMENEASTEVIETNESNIASLSPSPKPSLSNPYIHLATSANTRKAYQSDIRHYEMAGGKLPATPEMIANYLHFYADKLNPRTLTRRLIAIKHWHTYQRYVDPTLHPAIQKTMAGIVRTHGKPKQKARALLPDELAQIHQYLQNENTLAAFRDDALLQIGFFGALRRSELVAIHYEHIKWEKAGIEIMLPQSKTDQTHEGQYCAIPYGNNTLCPIVALKTWLETANIHTGAIFRRITLGEHIGDVALTPLSVNHILKNRARAANIHNSELLSAHSLRRGLATSAAKSGAPLQAIMRAGRWKQTNTVMEYIEASERFTDNAASNVLQNMINNTNE